MNVTCTCINTVRNTVIFVEPFLNWYESFVAAKKILEKRGFTCELIEGNSCLVAECGDTRMEFRELTGSHEDSEFDDLEIDPAYQVPDHLKTDVDHYESH